MTQTDAVTPTNPATPSSAITRVRFLRGLLEANRAALWRALNQIAEGPHRALLTEYPLADAGDANAIASDRTLDTLLEPEAVSITERSAHFTHQGLRWRFLKAYDQRSRTTEDTLPNHVTAHLLRALLTELRGLLHRLRADAHSDHGAVAALDAAATLQRRLHGLLLRCDALSQSPVLRDLPLDNNVLNGHPLYRQVLNALLVLRHNPP